MKRLIMFLAFSACDIDVSDFRSSSHKEEYYHQYCGICVGYQNNQYPAEIYVVLENCTEYGDNIYIRGACKHNNCYMECHPENFACKETSKIVICD